MLYKLQYNQVHKSADNSLFNRRVVLTCFMRLVASMLGSILSFFHPIGVSLAESFNLVSNVWHVEIMM